MLTNKDYRPGDQLESTVSGFTSKSVCIDGLKKLINIIDLFHFFFTKT